MHNFLMLMEVWGAQICNSHTDMRTNVHTIRQQRAQALINLQEVCLFME